MADETTNQPNDLNDAELAARTMAQAKAQLPHIPNPWEEQASDPNSASTRAGNYVNEKVIAPFRQGLDNMGEDLQQAGESGHTQSGGQLGGPARALASGVGTLLKAAPVGHDMKGTLAANIMPPTLPEGHLFEGLRVIPSAPMAAEEANALRQWAGKDLASEGELNAARKTKAEYDANVALSKGKVDTDPKASVPSKNRRVSDLKEGSSVTEHSGPRGNEPASAMSTEEKADLEKWHGQPLNSDKDYILARKQKAEWDSNQALAAGKVDTDPKANVPSKNKNAAQNPKNVIESQGLVHKGEVVKGSGVHMFEHPDHPGKTAALQEPFTPADVQKKMDSKLEEFGVLQPIKYGDAKADAVKNLGKKKAADPNANNKIVIEGIDEPPAKKPEGAYYDKNRIDPWNPKYSHQAGHKEPTTRT